MRTLLVTSMLLLGGACCAFAGTPIDHYRDLIRPHGHPRSNAVFQTSLDRCYSRTGADRTKHDTPAFKQCMATQHYRWLHASRSPAPARRQPATQAAAGWPPFHVEIGFGGTASSNDSPSTPNPSADIDRTNQMNAAAQDQVNAGIAATTQTEVQFNTIYSQGN